MKRIAIASILVLLLARVPARAGAAAENCPAGGVVRFGVEPFDNAARMIPAFEALGKLLAAKLGCDVQMWIPTNYNAEIEAMRGGKLEIGEFGPLGYVLAKRLAGADVFATFGDAKGRPIPYLASIVTWRGSGITSLAGVANHSFAYSEPASTSGHLFPAYGLRKHGIDPDRGVIPLFAGSHPAAFEAIRNHKVDAGELNSTEIEAASAAGEYDPAEWITLWRSPPIPNDPVAVRRDLPAAFKQRLRKAVLSLDFAELPAEFVRVFPATGTRRFAAIGDSSYDVVRDLVKTLGVDLNRLS